MKFCYTGIYMKNDEGVIPQNIIVPGIRIIRKVRQLGHTRHGFRINFETNNFALYSLSFSCQLTNVHDKSNVPHTPFTNLPTPI